MTINTFVFSSVFLSLVAMAHPIENKNYSDQHNDQAVVIAKINKHRQFRESLLLAEKHWKIVRPSEYKFQIQLSCFCLDTEPKVVFVKNRKVIQVRDAKSGQTRDMGRYANYSIDGLLNLIKNYLNDSPAEIGGSFDAVRGIPVHFYVDVNEQIADEELALTITQFEIIKK